MKAVQLKENIYWVGGVDWDLRNFHGYLTQRGSTYNAYIIKDEKTVLVDTAKLHLADELIERIRSVADPASIDYVVANHVEMDHSGSLPRIMELCPNATIITSAAGEKGLRAHYGADWKFQVVGNGAEISLGKRKLSFVMTPMVHWPDNMLTFLSEDNILFSNDAFGQHLATSERFDDEYPLAIIEEEARKYYANIVLPYGIQVQKALEQAGDLPIQMIAPSHGIIWRSHIPRVLELYAGWASNATRKKAVIVYDTMWGSTKKMAYAIASAFEEKGIHYCMHDLKLSHVSDIMTEIIDAEYLCVGSPTLNNGILPTAAGFLTYLKGLAPKGRKAIIFGSYGWGGQSAQIIEQELTAAKFTVVKNFKTQYIPDTAVLTGIRNDVLAAL